MNPSPLDLLQQVDTFIIRVSAISLAEKWYTEKLGLKPLWHDAQLALTVLDAKGAASITIWQTDEPLQVNRQTTAYPIFRTPDAAALRDELINRAVEVTEVIIDHHVSYFRFFDPDGNMLEACQVHE